MEEKIHPIEEIIILDEENPILANSKTKLTLEIKNDLEFYIFGCAKALTAVSSAIEKSRLSLSFLDIKHIKKITSTDHSQADHIELLVEHTIIRVQSVYDRTLIFVNKLLDLGISNESINHNLLITNEKVKKYSLDKKLKNINKACQEYKNIRNTVIHHDRYTEEALDRLGLVIKADHLSRKNNGKEFINPRVLNRHIKDYLTFKKSDLEIYINQIEQKIHDLFNSAIPVYKAYKEKIRALK